MSLKIYYSDKIEDLGEVLKALLMVRRGDPFRFPQVIVPNPNIAKWLRIRMFAKEAGLCAGVEFPFMEKRFTELMAASLEEGEVYERPDEHSYARAVMQLLMDDEAEELEPLRRYVRGDEGSGRLGERFTRIEARMAWQLAEKLAGLMDQYEVRRPEIVANWLEGKSARGGDLGEADEIEKAEAHLARRMWGEGGEFDPAKGRMSMRQLFDRVKGKEPAGEKETIWFFGQSILSALQVQILAWLAKKHEVVVLHNNVCLEYWGDVESRAEEGRKWRAAKVDGEELGRLLRSGEEDIACDNELLKEWGAAGRETLRLIAEAEESSGVEVEWTCVSSETGDGAGAKDTVLKKVQDTVRRRTGETEKKAQDASLQIVGAPGVRREVELVYNAILGSVWQPEGSGKRPWEACKFSDIAVLVPDMATYRPAIEAVFDARGQIPYGLIDTTAGEDSRYLGGLMALAKLGRDGLTRENLFGALDNPCVQLGMGFGPEEVREWRRLTDMKLGAFDGWEREAGDNGKYFSWEWALARLRLGQVAGGAVKYTPRGGGETAMPLIAQSNREALKFSETVELLWRGVRNAFYGEDGEKAVLPMRAEGEDGEEADCWAARFAKLADEILAAPKDNQLENAVKNQIPRTLRALGGMRGDFELAAAAVETFTGGMPCRKGGYLTNGVTIAGLQPMRPVPFRQVFVLGMGAGGFPGKVRTSTLDIRGAEWRLGDVSGPKVNRFLFLELLMSVRERLVITYPRLDLEKDAELFPSALVNELETFAGRHVVEGGEFREFAGYPLLEHGEREDLGRECVDDVEWRTDDWGAGILPTYSETARKTANLRRRGLEAEKKEGGAEARKEEAAEVTVRELAEFLADPMKTVMRRRFGVRVEEHLDENIEGNSPLELGREMKRKIHADVMELILANAGNGWDEGTLRAEAEKAFDAAIKAEEPTGGTARGFGQAIDAAGYKEQIAVVKKPRARSDRLMDFYNLFAGMGMGANEAEAVAATVELADGRKCAVRAEPRHRYRTKEGTCVPVVATGSSKVKGYELTRGHLTAFLEHLCRVCAGEDGGKGLALVHANLKAGATDSVMKIGGIGKKEAEEYLAGLAGEYLEAAEGKREIVKCDFTKFAGAIEAGEGGDGPKYNWGKILRAMSDEEAGAFGGKGGGDWGLAVGGILKEHERTPKDEAELEETVRRRFGLLFGKIEPGESGQKEAK